MIVIIDYDAGNLKSVEKAFQYIGADVKVSKDADEIMNADALILPGVGAFADCMGSLKNGGIDKLIPLFISTGKPFLGICLGFQLLFEASEENASVSNQVPGLGIIKGTVKRIPANIGLKVPHIGWNLLEIKRDSPLFNGLPRSLYVYFVHSYYADAYNSDVVIAKTTYGISFDVAIQKGNVFATQFHPEKSGEIGIKMLKNFIEVVYKK